MNAPNHNLDSLFLLQCWCCAFPSCSRGGCCRRSTRSSCTCWSSWRSTCSVAAPQRAWQPACLPSPAAVWLLPSSMASVMLALGYEQDSTAHCHTSCIETWTKWPEFCWWHFWMNFLTLTENCTSLTFWFLIIHQGSFDNKSWLVWRMLTASPS